MKVRIGVEIAFLILGVVHLTIASPIKQPLTPSIIGIPPSRPKANPNSRSEVEYVFQNEDGKLPLPVQKDAPAVVEKFLKKFGVKGKLKKGSEFRGYPYNLIRFGIGDDDWGQVIRTDEGITGLLFRGDLVSFAVDRNIIPDRKTVAIDPMTYFNDALQKARREHDRRIRESESSRPNWRSKIKSWWQRGRNWKQRQRQDELETMTLASSDDGIVAPLPGSDSELSAERLMQAR
ncbi:hypothetical protein F5878DRAFT_417509 [Lentinula raphanica]|uniref:Uncharacterized protein n=1 Tax=Lentinula raphanica TaxID=153919 RepID=A0AA38NZ07_9AGAR|nr:hypothetical protein F5878DRAFT_417509 [Lentinula raphanica]